MNLLLNASNLRLGGDKTIAQQLIEAVAPLRPNDRLYVLAPQGAGYEELARHANITILPLPDRFSRSWLSQLWHLYRVFPGWCDRLKIDKVISLGNVAFPVRGRPQAVLIQLPQLVYHESPAWKLMNMTAFLRNSLKDQFVALHMRYATAYAVQTEVMRNRLINRFKLAEEKVHLIPAAPIRREDIVSSPLPQPLVPLKLLFLSPYAPHKYFECLPAIAQWLKERQIPVEITLTISAREAPGAEAVLRAVRPHACIHNIGPVALKDVGALLQSHHGIFLPSLMESFSGAYAEALQYRRLIFTSHYDFATSQLGEAAFYFDPLNPESIARIFEQVIHNPSLIEEKLPAIDAAARAACDVAGVAKSFSKVIDDLV